MKTTATKTIAEAIKEGNSTTNQRIKGEFIEKHVYCNVNQMVEYILRQDDYKNAPFTMEDIENYFSYPEYIGEHANFDGGTDEQRTEEIERLKALLESGGETLKNISKIEEEIEELENLDSECAEIFEYWKVSDYLCRKLSEMGYCIIDDENIWGRTTTGQAILLDGVITRICAEMEILDGQSSSWANY